MSLRRHFAWLLALAVLVPAASAVPFDEDKEKPWKVLRQRGADLQLQGRFAEQLNNNLEELKLAETLFGAEHRKTAESHLVVGMAYSNRGQYDDAMRHFQRALEIQEKVRGPNHPDVAFVLDELGGLYFTLGMYVEAEAAFRRALQIEEKAFGPGHPVSALTLERLALLYETQGKYKEAEGALRRSVEMIDQITWLRNADGGLTYAILAGFFLRQGRFDEAEALYRRVLKVISMRLKVHWVVNHPYYRETTAAALGTVYRAQGRYAEAEAELRAALPPLEAFFGKEDRRIAAPLIELGSALYGQGKYDEAAALFARAIQIYEKSLGPNHPRVGRPVQALAELYYARGQAQQAEPYFDRRIDLLSRQFQYHFTYMSEKERLAFLDTLGSTFPLYFSFCYSQRDRNPALVGKMYDVLLWQKGFVAASVAALRSQIAAHGDAETLALLDQLQQRKNQLARLITVPPKDPEQARLLVEKVERESNELERQLVRRSSLLAEEKRLQQVTWRDVQKALKPGEAAVEFARFRFHDGKRLTDTAYYVALIVTPETTTAPALVLLGEAARLEGPALNSYRRLVDRQAEAGPNAATEASAFWSPLEAALGNTRSIYLSPDGVLNVVSLGLVPTADGKLLLEKHDLHVLTSTKDLLRTAPASTSDSAVLVGNPRFNLTADEQRAALMQVGREAVAPVLVASANPSSALRKAREGGALEPLPGTALELEAVRVLLEQKKWQVRVFAESAALEEAVKRARSPRLLHLATHGFFLGEQGAAADAAAEVNPGLENPMMRSGLFFAGAERALLGERPAEGLEDGVLTAYEAAALDLQGAELVVLSACETGLGQVRNGEGVFGLRRALQIAGARAVLMSLWAVPDRETQELMGLFYEKWLAGAENHDALRAAQLEMRQRIRERYGKDLPHYWGGFILVGP